MKPFSDKNIYGLIEVANNGKQWIAMLIKRLERHNQLVSLDLFPSNKSRKECRIQISLDNQNIDCIVSLKKSNKLNKVFKLNKGES